ncbi:family 20 glycosylhydrolase [Flavobacteriaceae bacterium KMM 6898]|nr:family 20 glycosylhydrolase [Flavobacteriaceae bacterium KMM 6898]
MIYKNIVYYFLLVLIFTTASCHTSKRSNDSKDITVIPVPKDVVIKKGNFNFSNTTTVGVEDETLLPIANILADYTKRITGTSVLVTNEITESSSIVLKYNKVLSSNAYLVNVGEKISLEASSFASLTNAVATLVQLIKLDNEGSYVPNVAIKDSSDLEFRSVMLDLARFWHPTETIKETIDLLWLYKIPYLHLHLSDNNRFTFPLEDFPEINKVNSNGDREYYTKEELNDLVEYAQDRGVNIIPEVDLPGHSTILWQTYPEVFGSLNPKTNKPEQLHVINIAKEKTYEAVNTIIKELAAVFYTSPYIHVGGDEVYLENLKRVPEYQKYTSENGLAVAADGDANELFCHFINKMNQMVKATGKKTIVWEGFHGTGAGNVVVDKDITIIVWNSTYNDPNNLLENGYEIINSTWIPWYMVGAMNLAPSIDRAYNWEITNWGHWDNTVKDVSTNASTKIIGAQISYWEQNHFKVIPVLKDRVPILAERLWNKTAHKNLKDFKEDLSISSKLYTKLFRPISSTVSNLVQEKDLKFVSKAQVVLDNSKDANYSWAFSKSWNIPSKENMTLYTTPVELTESGVLTIQKQDAAGNRIGYSEQTYYQKITPSYNYKVYGPAPVKGWDSIPDFSKIPLVREGVSSKVSDERLDKINEELFAKVERIGHIDTRFNGIYNPYALELEGNIFLDKETEMTLKLQTHDGLANVYIDDALVAKGKEFKNIPEEYTVKLKQGKHKVKIEYFYQQIQNQLNLMYKTDKMQSFAPFEELVIALQ